MGGPATAKDRVGYLYVPPRPKPSVLTKEERAALQKRIADTRLRRVDAARRDAASFCEYVLRDEASLREIRLAPAQERLQTFLDQNAQCVCWAHIEYGKALALDTPIPTPSGWTTMGALRPGDKVFDQYGRPCSVTEVTPVMHEHRVYRVVFDDGESMLADAEHRWIAKTVDDAIRQAQSKEPSRARLGDGDPCACGCGLRANSGKRFIHNHHGRRQNSPDGWRVVTTEQMLVAGITRASGAKRKDGTKYDQYVWRMPLPEPVQYPERDLPVHPYVLGAWLGDGNANGPVLTMHEDDREIGDLCAQYEGHDPRVRIDATRSHIQQALLARPTRFGSSEGCLQARLRALDVLHNKHIPPAYLTASVEQRRDLLAGLLDTDGSANPRGNVEFCNTNQRIAEGVLELVRSLGIKATIAASDAKLKGRVVGTKYRVTFTPKVPVFRLRRKLVRQQFGTPSGRISYRSVVAIEPVPTVPVRCIAVDSPNHSYLAGRGYAVTHNSSLVSVGRVLWELGRNPNLRVAIVSETDGKAMKLLRGIKRYVQHSKELHEVFPHLVRSKRPDDPWNKHAITIQRESFARDPSIQVTGCGGSIIGSRVDLLVLDDILSDRTAITKNAQEKLLAWYNSNCAGRLTEHGRIFAVGTPWSTSDLYHHLAKTPGWVSKKFPVIDPETGLPTWPENWSLTRIAQARIRLGPLEAARQLDCEPASESTNRFQEAWITRALNDGGQCDFVQEWAELFPEDTPPHLQVLPDGCFTVTGVDVGASMRASGGLTVLTTLLVYPSGIRQILCIESGRWTGPEILRRCFDHHRRYRSTIFVETNAAQRFLLDFAEEIEGDIPPIRPHTTGRNKHDPTFGVESIGVEMFQGRWWFPNDPEDRNHLHPELEGLLAEMRKYTPDSHMGDRLSSCWISNMGAHTMRRGPPRGRARVRSFAPVDSDRRDVDV